MSGMESIIKLTRGILGDLDSAIYTDSRLAEVVTIAAMYLQAIATFSETYVIDIPNDTITPDPTDSNFIVLCAYKAACMVSTYELKNNTAGFSIKDGPSSLDSKDTSKNKKDGMMSICEVFDKLLGEYRLGGGVNGGLGQAILGPYSPGSDLISWTSPDFRGAEWQ